MPASCFRRTLWQTCFSSYVGEKVSVRLSREIDKRARLVFFVDYVISITTISLMPKNQVRIRVRVRVRAASSSCLQPYAPSCNPLVCPRACT